MLPAFDNFHDDEILEKRSGVVCVFQSRWTWRLAQPGSQAGVGEVKLAFLDECFADVFVERRQEIDNACSDGNVKPIAGSFRRNADGFLDFADGKFLTNAACQYA